MALSKDSHWISTVGYLFVVGCVVYVVHPLIGPTIDAVRAFHAEVETIDTDTPPSPSTVEPGNLAHRQADAYTNPTGPVPTVPPPPLPPTLAPSTTLPLPTYPPDAATPTTGPRAQCEHVLQPDCDRR